MNLFKVLYVRLPIVRWRVLYKDWRWEGQFLSSLLRPCICILYPVFWNLYFLFCTHDQIRYCKIKNLSQLFPMSQCPPTRWSFHQKGWKEPGFIFCWWKYKIVNHICFNKNTTEKSGKHKVLLLATNSLETMRFFVDTNSLEIDYLFHCSQLTTTFKTSSSCDKSEAICNQIVMYLILEAINYYYYN